MAAALPTQGGDNDDRHLLQLILVLAQQVHAVLPRHLEVEQSQRHGRVAERLGCLKAVRRLQHSVAFRLEQQAKVGADRGVVVRYQDRRLKVCLRHDAIPLKEGPLGPRLSSRLQQPMSSLGHRNDHSEGCPRPFRF